MYVWDSGILNDIFASSQNVPVDFLPRLFLADAPPVCGSRWFENNGGSRSKAQ